MGWPIDDPDGDFDQEPPIKPVIYEQFDKYMVNMWLICG